MRRAVESDLAELVTATIHPSASLRRRDDAGRHAETDAVVRNLGIVARVL